MKFSLFLTLLMSLFCLLIVTILVFIVARSIGRPMQILMKLTKIFKTNKDDSEEKFNKLI